jgi:hypothetical protein
MDLAINPVNILKHLQNLTGGFKYNNKKIYYIQIYSQKRDGRYTPIEAKGEGIACVDDLARAVILALEIYEFFGSKEALRQAKEWLTFLEYMQDEKGYMTNFISDMKGQKKYGVLSSYSGGAWWSSRSKWAWAKAYKATKEKKYLDLYFKTKITKDYENNVTSILLLAGLEVFELEDKKYLKNLLERILSCQSSDGYFLHAKNAPMHMWAYHELEAVAKSIRHFGENKQSKALCEKTVDNLANDVIKNGFYFEYLTRDKREINPYCVSPLVRGIYELNLFNKKEKYDILLKKCFEWFEKMYDPTSGACNDWVHEDNISTDCGAEASIEAGFCYLRKLKSKV